MLSKEGIKGALQLMPKHVRQSVREGIPLTELEYDLSPNDFLAFNEHYLSTSEHMQPFLRRFRIQMTLLVPLLSMALLTVMLRDPWFAGVVALMAAIVSWLISPALFARQVGRNIRTMAAVAPLGNSGRHVLRIEDDGLRESSPTGELLVPWRNVRGMDESDAHVYVWFGPTQAFVIPKRIEAHQLQSFRDGLQQHLIRGLVPQ